MASTQTDAKERSGPYTYIGKSMPREEGPAKLVGAGGYVADLDPAGSWFAHLVLSPHPHARVRAIDDTAAKKLPGVKAVFRGSELAEASLFATDEVFYAGEPVAVVVADDPVVAEDAAELVEVDYEILPAVVDPERAMQRDAPVVRQLEDTHGRADEGAHGESVAGAEEQRPNNVSSVVRFHRGDVAAAKAAAATVVSRRYRLPPLYQGFLETHGSSAETTRAGETTVWTTTQGQFAVRNQVKRLLNLPDYRVRVVGATVGGGFGGKGVLLEPLVATLSRRLGRPVAMMLDRQQDILLNNPGPGADIEVTLAATRDGTLTALEARLVFDNGCERGGSAGGAASGLAGVYRVANLDVVGYDVMTHKVPVGAYRAPGAPQAYFAIESAMDELARALNMDPVELRLKNAVREGDERPNGRPWPRIGLVECLEAAQGHPFFREPLGPNEGIGVAVGGWGGGLEPAAAMCQVSSEGRLIVQVGFIDITGTNTTMALIAAEALGVSPDQVHVESSDTSRAPYAGFAGGSKTTYTVGVAVAEAAKEVRRQVLEVAASRLEAAVEDLDLKDGRVSVKGVPGRSVTLAELARDTARFGGQTPPLIGHGRSAVTKSAPGFAVHAARVKVDPDTGEVRVTGYLAIQDVGRALNPKEVEGQIMGGVAQGIGRALLEDLAYDATGQPVSTSFLDYQMPTVHDVPRIDVVLVEVPAEDGPYGAKGVGEPPAIPGAAAIANAVASATGRRVTDLPITPERVLAAPLQ
jgi:CO/xanthine dehydrogenase Mo-binding subunit